MKDNEITITETLAEIEKHRTEYAIRREEEEGYVNHSYRDEQILMQAIKDGDADTILVANRSRLFRGPLPEELRRLPVHALKERSLDLER